MDPGEWDYLVVLGGGPLGPLLSDSEESESEDEEDDPYENTVADSVTSD